MKKSLPDSLTAIMNGSGREQVTVTLTLTANALRLVAGWAAAEGSNLDTEVSNLIEARAQEDLRTMEPDELAEIEAIDWQAVTIPRPS